MQNTNYNHANYSIDASTVRCAFMLFEDLAAILVYDLSKETMGRIYTLDRTYSDSSLIPYDY